MAPLGPRRKIFATAVLIFGLLSFFLPLIKLETPVLGRNLWSPYTVAVAIYEEKLPPRTIAGDFLSELPASIPMMMSTICLLQVMALLTLAISRSPVLLKNLAMIGVFSSWFWRGDRLSFETLFYGTFSFHNFSPVRRVGFGEHTVILLGVMAALWYIAANDDLDAEQDAPAGTDRHSLL